MVKKKIKVSDILGDSYYVYELTSSNYTPALNGSITITCTMKDIYGTATGSKSVTLYQNGTSKGAQTTNSSGVATWSITCSTAGLQKFSVQDTSIEVFVDNKSNTDHTHGNLQNNGQVGSTAQANKNVVTNSSGLITTEDKPTIPSKTSQLTNDSGFLTSHQSLDSKTVTVEKLATAESGYLSSYVVKQNGVQVGNTINIPKDFLVKSGSVKTVSTANNPVSGYIIGDKYIDLVINVQEGTSTDSHIYILVSDLIDTPVAISDVTGLQTALNNKASSTHTHDGEDITNITPAEFGSGSLYDPDPYAYDVMTQEGVSIDENLSTYASYVNIALNNKANNNHTHNQYLTAHQDISGKLDKSQTSYKGKNVIVDGTTGNISFENKNAHNHGNIQSNGIITVNNSPQTNKNVCTDSSGYITIEEKNNHTHSNYLTSHQDLSNYVTTDDSRLSDARTPTSHTHTKSQITDFPTLPTASSTVPSADTTNGSYGSGTSYARSNHTHPKSSLYATSSHTHSQFYTKGEVDSLLSAYRSYEISPSTYNASIDSYINVNVTVKDMSGNGVANENVSLFYSGLNLGPIELIGTTDSNGVATFSNIQLIEWGITDWRVGSEHCQINVTGWREITEYRVTQSNTPTIQAYTNGEYVRIRLKGHTISSVGTNWVTISETDNKMPSQYCPPYGDLTSYMIYAKTEVAVWNNGKLSIRVFDGNARAVTMRGDIVYPIS